MKTFKAIPVIAAGIAITACGTTQTVTTTSPAPSTGVTTTYLPASNPFAAPSTLPFQTPNFAAIKESDYRPAFAAGMKQQLAEIDAITSQSSAPTFDNTIIPLEKSGAILTRVSKVFNHLTAANTDDTLQAIQEEVAPKLASHSDAIFLNDKLYQRVKSLYDRRDQLGLNQQQKALVEYYNRNFVRAGANLSEADKTKLKALNQEEASLTTDFTNKLIAATKAGALVIDDVKLLDGFSDQQIAAAAAAAKQRNMDGKWVIPLQNTTQHPAQISLKNRATRQRLFEASTNRTEHGDANDTRATIKRLAELRSERAKLLGYPNYSAYALETAMAKTPANATKLLTDLVPASVAKAKSEIKVMQALIDKEGGKLQARSVGLSVLRGAGEKSAVRAR
jgi:peptidyl-dipeptidase Dcp